MLQLSALDLGVCAQTLRHPHQQQDLPLPLLMSSLLECPVRPASSPLTLAGLDRC